MIKYLPIVCAIAFTLSACGRSEQKPAPASPPEFLSKEWGNLVAENNRKNEAKYKANRIKPGGKYKIGPFEISNIGVRRVGTEIEISVALKNITGNRVVPLMYIIDGGSDEHGNELDFDNTNINAENINKFGDRFKETQPGESGTVKIFVAPKLKSAKKASVKIQSGGSDDETSANWTLEFDIPPAD